MAVCLDRARRCAMRARLDRRVDSDEQIPVGVCADCPFQDETLALFLKLMPHALGKRVTFHRPGSDNATFDEAWMLRLLASIRSGDEDSANFAISSRVRPGMQPAMRRLAVRCAESLDAETLELF